MLLSYKWLRKYLPELHEYQHSDVAAALTNTLAEVESIKDIRTELTEIFVGEVISAEKHPKSDRLSVCQVKLADDKTFQIICGAPNVRAGIKVAVCLSGGSVSDVKNPGEVMRIETREVLGEFSEGMICSGKELMINEDHEGILELEDTAALGTSLTDELWDTIYDIENKALGHRGYAFSHMGIAREISAALNTPFAEPATIDNSLPLDNTIDFSLTVKVPVEFCQRFSALLIKDVIVSKSPFWMQALLSGVGSRPINNIVDITNYIMLDRGQPLHAYDYNKLAGNKLIVRKAKEGESAKTLDGKEHKLDKSTIVVADNKSVEDIAGIMGGFNSQIDENTKIIVLEAANFDMYNIRRSSRQLKIRTEASSRFEKGLDPMQTVPTLNAAASMISDIIPQVEMASPIIDHFPAERIEKNIKVDINLINRYLGLDLSRQEILDYLERLDIVPDEHDDDDSDMSESAKFVYDFSIPTYRTDLTIPQDIVEEVARLYGYNNLIPKMPERNIEQAPVNKVAVYIKTFIEKYTAAGFDEVMTYSFIGENAYSALKLNINNCLKISNPIAPELSHMRNNLVASIMQAVTHNAKYQSNFAIFELNRVVYKQLDDSGIHQQPFKIAAATYNRNSPDEYSVLKSKIDAIAHNLSVQLAYEQLTDSAFTEFAPMLHTGRMATIKCNDNYLGFIGEVSPSVADALGLVGRVAICQLDFSLLMDIVGSNKIKYKAISNFPSVTRDISFWTALSTPYQDVQNAVTNVQNPLIVGVELVDVFNKPEEDRKSITVSVVLQSQEGTLTDTEIQATIAEIEKAIESSAKAEIR